MDAITRNRGPTSLLSAASEALIGRRANAVCRVSTAPTAVRIPRFGVVLSDNYFSPRGRM